MALESIRDLVKNDLTKTDHFIISELESNIPLIREVIEYVLSCGGKRVRPMVLLLTAHALGEPSAKHINLAAVIELIHTATLLHDDVVDSSTLRRGNKTAHMIWGSNTSVLVGDFLYSRAFQLVVGLDNTQIMKIFAEATHYIAEGEILQLINCNNADATEEFYFDIIRRKTGRLFEIASQLAAILSDASNEQIEGLRQYGESLGLAYQLIDDVLDYSMSADETGKNIGQDIADGKATLPLIYAMRQSSGNDLALIREAIKSGSSEQLDEIMRIIKATNAIDYTAKAAKSYATKAKQGLESLPASKYKTAMEQLADFVVDRSY